MLRLSKLADYATVVLVRLGARGTLATAAALAQETGVPEPTVAKLLKGLAAGGLVASFRGARGGYRLVDELKDISIARVITVVDGPILVTACCDGRECAHGETCGLSGQWDTVNRAVRQALESISLADMANPDLKFDPSSAASAEATMRVAEGQGGCHAGCIGNS